MQHTDNIYIERMLALRRRRAELRKRQQRKVAAIRLCGWDLPASMRPDTDAIIRIAADGSALEARKIRNRAYPRSGGGLRGVVRGFSVASRRRLMRRLGWLDKRKLPLFVTLTYHNEWGDRRAVKDDLRKFAQALRRRFPRAALIWRLEYQKRGAPHFHLLLYGVPLPARDIVAHIWADVVERSTGERSDYHREWHLGHLRNQHCVQQLRSWRGVISYASKYLAKVDDGDGDEETGRVWGIINRDDIPDATITVVASLDAYYRIRRHVRDMLAQRGIDAWWLRRRYSHTYHAYIIDARYVYDLLTHTSQTIDNL